MSTVKRYRDYADFLCGFFAGKVQKIAIDGGFTCPNRDGSKGRGGCLYCSNSAFTPRYSNRVESIPDQIAAGKRFFAGRYSHMRYLAYFQSYSGTYAPVSVLRQTYTQALADEEVAGLVVSTRPDCITPEVVELLREFSSRTVVIVELGVESSHDATLRAVNRCHTWQDAVSAVGTLHDACIPCGVHLILGLPGESLQMMASTVLRVAELPVNTVKLHQLQLVYGTRLAADYAAGLLPILRFSPDGYARFCIEAIRHMPPTVAFDRFVSQMPSHLLVGPRWGLKQSRFQDMLAAMLTEADARQGDRLNRPFSLSSVDARLQYVSDGGIRTC